MGSKLWTGGGGGFGIRVVVVVLEGRDDWGGFGLWDVDRVDPVFNKHWVGFCLVGQK